MFALRRRLLRARRSHRPRAAAKQGREPAGPGRGGEEDGRRRAAEAEAGQEGAAAEAARLGRSSSGRGGGPPLSPVRRRREGRRRQRGAPTCPFGGGGCALRRADTVPRALTHWPTLARPASGRASLSLSSLSPAGWRQRPECTPRGAPWDSSGLRELPAHGPAPLALGPAPAPPLPRAEPPARDGTAPRAFPPVVAAQSADLLGSGSGRGLPGCHCAQAGRRPAAATNKARREKGPDSSVIHFLQRFGSSATS
ncbi:Wilms tumor protein 1-interacting protein-like isoform X2 [Meriones unguiculatus]|uniref:Wilms tumor protein 1-interacting protein-like isoform X2 n=1 Tax=Meriones unguiculatus TaxID=10047 RepID=UPI00293F3176|nr:Wilms tumor protein 1-interacting protein-like isoform X2 [Meriones unguiculatus]